MARLENLTHPLQEVFASHLRQMVEALEMRILPTFDSIEAEADALSKAKWEMWMARPCSGESDSSDYVDQANDAGVAHYMSMEGVRQSLLNLYAPALYHAWEQQLSIFYRHLLRSLHRRNDAVSVTVDEITSDMLIVCYIDLRNFTSWNNIDELRLVANTVKHRSGPSAQKLKTIRPDLFMLPSLRGSEQEQSPWLHHAEAPLGGSGFYITLNDLKGYRDALLVFWEELGAHWQETL